MSKGKGGKPSTTPNQSGKGRDNNPPKPKETPKPKKWEREEGDLIPFFFILNKKASV